MDHSYIAEHNVAARYVIGTLEPGECALFEEHFLDCPECLAEIQTTRDFHAGLKEVAARQPWVPAPSPARWPMVLAWAACLVAVVAATWAGVELRRAQRQAGEWAALYSSQSRQMAQVHPPTAAMAGVPIFPLVLSRSADAAGTPNRVFLPAVPQWVVLALDRAGLPEASEYHASLEDPAGKTIASLGQLQAVSPDALGIGIHSGLLRPGVYVLVIEAPATEGPAGTRYPFRAVPVR